MYLRRTNLRRKVTGQSPVGSGVSLKGIKSGGVCAGRCREEKWRGLTLLLLGLHLELLSSSFSSAHIQHYRYFFSDGFLAAFIPKNNFFPEIPCNESLSYHPLDGSCLQNQTQPAAEERFRPGVGYKHMPQSRSLYAQADGN